ncbi:MAG: fimbria/pilus outer membrane usher protein [Geobacteraceae bacterium]
MLTNQCVNNKHLFNISFPFIISILFVSFLAAFPLTSLASQAIIVSVILNQEAKGEYFVNLADDGDFLVKTDDLKSMGFTGPFPKPVEVDNESYVSLKSFTGVTFTFDNNNLTLEVTATPTLLPKRVLDFTPQQPLKVYYPKDSSAFFNYRLDYLTGNSFSFQGFNVTNELGIRSGDFLFLSNSSYTNNDALDKFVRLSSSLIYDRRQEMRRIVGGDFFASSGDLGAGVNLGGVSFSKLYRINPYFINRPTVGISGLVSLPSDMEVYLNGVRIRSDRLSPGEFELRNITGYGGVSLVEVVIRDAFGREQRIRRPFYFTTILLKKGLHEYSYNIGAVRREFGITSNHYGELAFSGFHNYGITDSLTLGLRGEWSRNAYNLGQQASILIPGSGTVTLSLSGSHNDAGNSGIAGLFAYSYQGKMINTRFFIKGFSRDYSTIAPAASLLKTRYEASAGGGYGAVKFGSLNLDLTSAQLYQGDTTQAVTASYSRNLTGNLNMSASLKRVIRPLSGNEFFVGLNYYPGKQISLTANYQRVGDTNTETLQVQKNQPLGEGVGFRSTLERTDSRNHSLNRFNPSVQYNARHGVYAADYSWQNTGSATTDSSRLSASGAIVYAGNTVGFTRPVSDSFALVKVGDVAGVRVNLNNQEIGRTDALGKVFAPEMGSFNHNQVSITDKDVPIDYLLSAKLKQVSPPYRSGSCVLFEATRMQAVTGIITAKVGNETKPLEFNEVTMNIDGKPVTFQTGGGGEFYLDNSMVNGRTATDIQEMDCQALDKAGAPFIKPGRHTAYVSYQDKTCSFDIQIPDSDNPIIDVGKIVCENPPADKPARKALPLPAPAPLMASDAPEPPKPESLMPPKPERRTAAKEKSAEAPPVSVEKQPQPSPPVKLEYIDMELFFRFDTDRFSSNEERAVLLTAIRLIKSTPVASSFLGGHTDQLGSNKYNMRLGKKRARRVALEMLNEGVDRGRISMKSFGKQRLKCSSLDEECRRQNRRVVIRLKLD